MSGSIDCIRWRLVLWVPVISSVAAPTVTRPCFCRLSPDELVANRVNDECYYFQVLSRPQVQV
jgi:hypothetical protein